MFPSRNIRGLSPDDIYGRTYGELHNSLILEDSDTIVSRIAFESKDYNRLQYNNRSLKRNWKKKQIQYPKNLEKKDKRKEM